MTVPIRERVLVLGFTLAGNERLHSRPKPGRQRPKRDGVVHVALQIQVAMKLHLRIAEDRDRGPGFYPESGSQKMIYSSADFFIIYCSQDAGDASVRM